jgi:hypothetical protein
MTSTDQLRTERINRPAAENRAEETHCAFDVAEWNAVPQKTDLLLVQIARDRAWSWVTSSTLVNRPGGLQPPGRYPV